MGQHHPADVRFGKAAHTQGWVDADAARDALRVVKVLHENGETTTLSRVLFEQDLLTARQVRQVQAKLGQREALCACGARVETHGKKPGAKARCPECKQSLQVPGLDLDDPFALPRSAASEGPSAGRAALGALCALGLAAVLGRAAYESLGSHLGLGAAITSGVAGLVALGVGVRGAPLGAAGVLLATLSGLCVAAALGNPPEAPAYGAWGVSAHAALPGLIVLHLLLGCAVVRQSLLRRGPDGVFAWVCLVSLYPLGFFVYRLLPQSDPTHYFTGPSVFAKVPWVAQPGTVALLYVFPAMALALGGASLVRSLRRRPGGLATHAGFVVSLLLLSGFGLAVGTVGGHLPTAGGPLEAHLAPRVGPHWRPAPAPHGTTAAAIEAR